MCSAAAASTSCVANHAFSAACLVLRLVVVRAARRPKAVALTVTFRQGALAKASYPQHPPRRSPPKKPPYPWRAIVSHDPVALLGSTPGSGALVSGL